MKKSKKKYVYSGKEELDNSSKFLRNYNLEIVKIFFNHLKSKGSKILDFGAGIGTLALKNPGLKLVSLNGRNLTSDNINSPE